MINPRTIFVGVFLFIAGVFIFYMYTNKDSNVLQSPQIVEVTPLETGVEEESEVTDIINTNSGSVNKEEVDVADPVLMCNKSVNKSSIKKPTGVFTSVLTDKAVQNGVDVMQGGLIRVEWARLEPKPGIFDFSAIEQKLALLPVGKKWSLAVHGGWTSVDQNDPQLYNGSTYPNGKPRPTLEPSMSPQWLVTDFDVDTFDMEFRGVTVQMPTYWHPQVQARLRVLMNALAKKYNTDPNLQLVYVPQMTSNGVEGHFNGVPDSTLLAAAGISGANTSAKDEFAAKWVQASLDASLAVAQAFDTKAVAFEVHELLGEASIPKTIMDTFLTDARFENRVGIAMWWISGGEGYQPQLVSYIKNYTGDVYGQVIGNSQQTNRYPNGDYRTVFTQAKELCMRYIEPWNYEFENMKFTDTMLDFNEYAETYFR